MPSLKEEHALPEGPWFEKAQDAKHYKQKGGCMREPMPLVREYLFPTRYLPFKATLLPVLRVLRILSSLSFSRSSL